MAVGAAKTVSYTHLDVYKRQLLLCSSGVYYMHTIANTLQGGTVILNEEGTASFDPQLIACLLYTSVLQSWQLHTMNVEA